MLLDLKFIPAPLLGPGAPSDGCRSCAALCPSVPCTSSGRCGTAAVAPPQYLYATKYTYVMELYSVDVPVGAFVALPFTRRKNHWAVVELSSRRFAALLDFTSNCSLNAQFIALNIEYNVRCHSLLGFTSGGQLHCVPYGAGRQLMQVAFILRLRNFVYLLNKMKVIVF